MTRKILDLSIPLSNALVADPAPMRPTIAYQSHVEGSHEWIETFPGLTAEDLPAGEGPALERCQLTTHNGTHLDAPWHFSSTMDGGVPSMTIDEVPLDWCIGHGVKLDFRHFPDGYLVQPADIDTELDRIGYQLKPLDIVLVNTAAGAALGDADYLDRGCGMGRDATLHLTGQGVKITGTDGWSWDAPFKFTKERYARDRDPAIIWEGHKAGRDRGYCHLEKLTNLDQLPAYGFQVICLPVKVERGSAGWTRAVAIID